MDTLEIFNTIVDKVCEVAKIRKESLYSTLKLQPIVEARILAAQYLWRAGFSSDEIALQILREQAGDQSFCPDISAIKSKAKGIEKQICAYQFRCKASYKFSIASAEISEFCKQKYGELYVFGMKEPPK